MVINLTLHVIKMAFLQIVWRDALIYNYYRIYNNDINKNKLLYMHY